MKARCRLHSLDYRLVDDLTLLVVNPKRARDGLDQPGWRVGLVENSGKQVRVFAGGRPLRGAGENDRDVRERGIRLHRECEFEP
jgi:hypothetical protein